MQRPAALANMVASVKEAEQAETSAVNDETEEPVTKKDQRGGSISEQGFSPRERQMSSLLRTCKSSRNKTYDEQNVQLNNCVQVSLRMINAKNLALAQAIHNLQSAELSAATCQDPS